MKEHRGQRGCSTRSKDLTLKWSRACSNQAVAVPLPYWQTSLQPRFLLFICLPNLAWIPLLGKETRKIKRILGNIIIGLKICGNLVDSRKSSTVMFSQMDTRWSARLKSWVSHSEIPKHSKLNQNAYAFTPRIYDINLEWNGLKKKLWDTDIPVLKQLFSFLSRIWLKPLPNVSVGVQSFNNSENIKHHW